MRPFYIRLHPFQLVILFLLFYLLPCAALKSQIDPFWKAKIDLLYHNVVALDSDEGKGFGMIVGEDERYLYIVTCSHVLHGTDYKSTSSNIKVRFYNSPHWYALPNNEDYYVARKDTEDMALFRVPLPSEEIPWIKEVVSSNDLNKQDPIALIGWRDKEYMDRWELLSGTFITVDNSNANKIVGAITGAEEGHSGTALLAKDGIIGMITRTGNGLEAISIKRIQEWLNYILPSKAYFQLTKMPPYPALNNMVLLPSGTFMMGDVLGSGYRNERPAHKVTINNFLLGKYEVSVKEYNEFLKYNPTQKPAWQDEKNDHYYEKGKSKYRKSNAPLNQLQNDDFPIVGVTWYNAVNYCNWLSKEEGRDPVYIINNKTVTFNPKADGYRLPTEAEWEYAARSGEPYNYEYAWGNNFNANIDKGNILIKDNNADNCKWLAPVDKFPQGKFGLHSMTGNVAEWCWDWYKVDYYESDFTLLPNPIGAQTGVSKIYRGGGWTSPEKFLHVSFRGYYTPDSHFEYLGFRLARNVENRQ